MLQTQGKVPILSPALLRVVAAWVAHLLVRDPVAAAGIRTLGLTNIVVVAIVIATALVLLLGEVDINRSRTRTTFPWQLRVLSLQLVGHKDLVQVLLQKAYVLAVALEGSVCQVAKEGDEANDKVEGQVEHHHEENTIGETACDLSHAHDEFESEQCVGCVTDSRHKTNDGRPTEAHAHETEQSEIHPVGSLAGSCEDIGFLLGDVGRDLLLDFLHLAWLPGVRNLLVVRVLTRGQLQLLVQCASSKHVEKTYIWPGSRLVGVLAHLACQHLLRCVLCDELRHVCGCVVVECGMGRSGRTGELGGRKGVLAWL